MMLRKCLMNPAGLPSIFGGAWGDGYFLRIFCAKNGVPYPTLGSVDSGFHRDRLHDKWGLGATKPIELEAQERAGPSESWQAIAGSQTSWLILPTTKSAKNQLSCE